MDRFSLVTWGLVVFVLTSLQHCRLSKACSGSFVSTPNMGVAMHVLPEDLVISINTYINATLASANLSERLEGKLKGEKDILKGSFKELVQAECLIHPANRAELCFVDRYGLAKEGNMSRVEEDAFWPFCRLSNEPHTVQGMGRNSPPPATDVDVSKDQETCNVEEQAVDVDELVDVILDVDGAECELVDAGELADDMFAEDRATYEPTHPRFVPYVSAKETIRDAVEAAKEHHQDFLESLASAMLDADLDLSAEASAGFEPQVGSGYSMQQL